MPLLTTDALCVNNCGRSAIGICEDCKKVLCRGCSLVIHASGYASEDGFSSFGGDTLQVMESLHGDNFPGRDDFLFHNIGGLSSIPNIFCMEDAMVRMLEPGLKPFQEWWSCNKELRCGTCSNPTEITCTFCRKPRCSNCSVGLLNGEDDFVVKTDLLIELGWNGKDGAICLNDIFRGMVSVHQMAAFETGWWNNHKTPEALAAWAGFSLRR